MIDAQPAGRTGLSLSVTVSSQAAFVPALEALARRVGEYVGCPADDALHLGQAVGRALADTWRHLGPARMPGRFDILFHGNGRLLRVDVTCPAPLPAGVTLEDALGGPAGVDQLRLLVDRIEFGHSGDCPFCRLTRQIREHR
jgi:hypothetical protein